MNIHKQLNWINDACGLYADYRWATIINQEHPKLIKYRICIEDENGELIDVNFASNLTGVFEIIQTEVSALMPEFEEKARTRSGRSYWILGLEFLEDKTPDGLMDKFVKYKILNRIKGEN